MNALYRTAEALEAEIAYDSEARDLAIENGRFVSASVALNGAVYEVQADTLVAAAGGFEANIPWLKQYWGDVADNFIVRGTPYNQGRLLRALLDRGASRSAIRRSATPSRSTGARPSSTAGSSPASTACRSASWSIRRAGASMTRARISGPSATPSGAGWWRSSRARSACDRRSEGARQVHAAGLPASAGGHDPRARRQARARSGRWRTPSQASMPQSGPGRSTGRRSTTAAPKVSGRPSRTGRCRSTRRPSPATRSGQGSPSPISGSRWTSGRG